MDYNHGLGSASCFERGFLLGGGWPSEGIFPKVRHIRISGFDHNTNA
jgi:hypothetical protein